ncbi:MAG TPA: SH3 domain-containing protein [Waterburya sp.]|jgi:NADH dehydrogenase/NADH:ubiquinone oxidoreductase subunit G
MNTRIPSTSVLIAASLSSLIFTVSAGATGTNRKAIEVKTDNSVEAAAPQDRYLIAGTTASCIVKDPKPPLNVRNAPNGSQVVGKLANGTEVELKGYQQDNKKRRWASIVTQKAQGWVLASSLTKCRVR